MNHKTMFVLAVFVFASGQVAAEEINVEIRATIAYVEGAPVDVGNFTPGTEVMIDFTVDTSVSDINANTNIGVYSPAGSMTFMNSDMTYSHPLMRLTVSNNTIDTIALTPYRSNHNSESPDDWFDWNPRNMRIDFSDSGDGIASPDMVTSDALPVSEPDWERLKVSFFHRGRVATRLYFDRVLDSDSDGIPDSLDSCPNSLSVGGNVVINGIDSGVDNTLQDDGCTVADVLEAQCIEDLASPNHGHFVSCVAQVTNALKRDGIISQKDKGKIQSAAARSR